LTEKLTSHETVQNQLLETDKKLSQELLSQKVGNTVGFCFFSSLLKGRPLIKKKTKFSSYTIQSGAVAKSYVRKGFLIYEEMLKYFPIYEEAVSHIYDFATAPF
jgi:hypothetical protein